MFSDRFRLLKIIIPLIIIFSLLFYAKIEGPKVYPGFSEAIKNPQNFIGKEINFGGRIVEIKDKYVLVKGDSRTMKVLLTISQENLNYDISGTGIFQKDKSVTPKVYHLSNLRQYKIFLSLVPLLVIFYFFFKRYKFDFRNFMFKKRNA